MKTPPIMSGVVVLAAIITGLHVSAAPRTVDPVEHAISLRAYEGPYVSATDGGGGTVTADRDQAGSSEVFALVDLDGGDLLDGDSVAIRTANGSYFQAENGGSGALNAIGSEAGSFETFRIFTLDNVNGTVNPGDAVVFLAPDNASFLWAENGGGGMVTSTGPSTGGWSKFQIVVY